MTWSIVAHDPVSGAFGVAVATCAFAVGASCPFVRSGVGAVSTQSMTNRYLGPAILDALAAGLSPAEAIERALTPDEGRHLRQVHAVDARGRTAVWTGQHCVEWCGEATGPHVSVAGNMLAGAEVVAATLRTYHAGGEADLAARMMAAMVAGEAAGGDRRGRQSAAMLVTTTEDFPDLNLRVDDHADPLAELERLEAVSRERFVHFARFFATRDEPGGTWDRATIDAAIAAATAGTGPGR